MIKLTDLKPTDFTFSLEIPGHPDEKSVRVTITHPDSKEYVLKAAEIYKSRGVLTENDINPEQAIQESAKLTASLIKNWEPNEFFGGKYSPELAEAVLMDFDNRWIRTQIEQKANDRVNFYKG